MAEIKDLKRMCLAHEDCEGCPFCCNCSSPDSFSDNADEIVDKWVKEHPVKTYAMDFFEKFPNAPKIRDGLPEPTACSVYGYSKLFEEHCESGLDCVSCWNEVMQDA